MNFPRLWHQFLQRTRTPINYTYGMRDGIKPQGMGGSRLQSILDKVALGKMIPSRSCNDRDGASIALIVRSKNEKPELFFIKRAVHEGDPWSGHIAFVGGKRENGETSSDCIRREVQEEIGVDITSKHDFEFLGHLPERTIRGRKGKLMLITTFIYLDKRPSEYSTFTLNKDEVQEGFWVDIEYLCNQLSSYDNKKASGSTLSLSIKSYIDRKKWNVIARSCFELVSIVFQVREISFDCVRLPPPPETTSPHNAFTLWGFSYYVTLDFIAIFTQNDHVLDRNYVSYSVDNPLLSKFMGFYLSAHATIFGPRSPGNPTNIIVASATSYALALGAGCYGIFQALSKLI